MAVVDRRPISAIVPGCAARRTATAGNAARTAVATPGSVASARTARPVTRSGNAPGSPCATRRAVRPGAVTTASAAPTSAIARRPRAVPAALAVATTALHARLARVTGNAERTVTRVRFASSRATAPTSSANATRRSAPRPAPRMAAVSVVPAIPACVLPAPPTMPAGTVPTSASTARPVRSAVRTRPAGRTMVEAARGTATAVQAIASMASVQPWSTSVGAHRVTHPPRAAPATPAAPRRC